MFKSITRFFLLLSLLVIISSSAGILSYVITSNILKADVKSNQTTNPESIQNQTKAINRQTNNAIKETSSVGFEFYTVRLEGETLSIYASANGKEEFLYTESVYINDLSSSDIEILKNGVTLSTHSELTSFIENFTS